MVLKSDLWSKSGFQYKCDARTTRAYPASKSFSTLMRKISKWYQNSFRLWLGSVGNFDKHYFHRSRKMLRLLLRIKTPCGLMTTVVRVTSQKLGRVTDSVFSLCFWAEGGKCVKLGLVDCYFQSILRRYALWVALDVRKNLYVTWVYLKRSA